MRNKFTFKILDKMSETKSGYRAIEIIKKGDEKNIELHNDDVINMKCKNGYFGLDVNPDGTINLRFDEYSTLED